MRCRNSTGVSLARATHSSSVRQQGVGSHNGFVMRIKIRVRKYFVWLRVHVVQSSPHFDSGSSLLRVWSLSQSVYLSFTATESKLSYQ